MAKGYGLSGNITGKKGNSIFYRIANSKNKVTQGIREYQPVVTNPKTTGQAEQRMKLAPALNFYRAFREVLDHSFEGLKYGSANYNRFMKEALNLKAPSLWPYVPKGYIDFVPGAYVVSRGSLTGIDVLGLQQQQDDTRLLINTGSTAEIEAALNPTEYVDQILNAYPQLQKGDQITLVLCGGEIQEYDYEPIFHRMVLDPDKIAAEIGDDYDYYSQYFFEFTTGGILTPYSHARFGAAVIVSRPTETNGVITWRRSNAQIFLNMGGTHWFSQEQYDLALESYMTSTPATNSEWYLNQGELSGGENVDVEAPSEKLAVANLMNYDGTKLVADWPDGANLTLSIARLTTPSTGAVAYVGEFKASGVQETPRMLQPFIWNDEQAQFTPTSVVMLEADTPETGITFVDRATALSLVNARGIASFVTIS